MAKARPKTMIILFVVCISIMYLIGWVMSGKYEKSELSTKTVEPVKTIEHEVDTTPRIAPLKFN